ncbi:cache domain-containing protein [Candidatus Avoscillospira sp. LCP25S3_F1]|uniref:cache domain-containing protein n=1 Tax=Candidatus Avoscillospira sp. LCP25S3_F1 TaxID=3438825 RepID=UPI003F93C160
MHLGGKQIKLGITPKLLLGILCPLIVCIILVSVFLGLQGSSIINKIISEQLDAQTNSAANEIDSFFSRYYGVAECLAATQIARDTTDTTDTFADHSQYRSLIETLQLIQQQDSENITSVWLVNLQTGESIQNDGMLYTSNDFDYSTRSWYTLVSSQQETIVTEVFTGTNGDVISVASPVYSDGTMVGVVGLDLNIDHMKDLLGEVKIGTTGYVTVYDSNSLIIYHPDQSLIDTNAADAGYSANMLNAIRNREDSNAMLYTRGQTQYYGSTVPIGNTGYIALGVMPVAEYTSHTAAILRVLIIGMGICVLLVTAICAIIAMSITRPLKRLNATVSKLADGELDVTVDVRTHDEVAEVGAGVARIVERLKEYILYIDEVSAVLNQIGAGNLMFTLQQNYVGEFAKVKSALMNIRTTLTETLTSIAQSADQVNAGAEQIASGA